MHTIDYITQHAAYIHWHVSSLKVYSQRMYDFTINSESGEEVHNFYETSLELSTLMMCDHQVLCVT